MARHGFVLTSRDVDILASLAQVRYLTIQHIQWLHWGERWRTAERTARAAGRVNQQPKRAYERVAAMAERGLIRSIQRSADRAATVYQRLPNALRLTSTGADLLARERGLPRTAVWYDDRPIRAATTVEHRLAIGAFYAALRAELTYRERHLEAWAADHILCTDYDSVAVASVAH
ncbi:MAG: hypothetical protein HC828_11510 [Blastochloris sp.]|nr:hypothetical protein [Blastochloris sp.]